MLSRNYSSAESEESDEESEEYDEEEPEESVDVNMWRWPPPPRW